MAEIDRYVVDEDAIRIGFVVFNGDVVYEQNLSGNNKVITDSISLINQLKRGGGTSISNALRHTEEIFEESLLARPVDIQRAMILLSDGDPRSSYISPVDYDDIKVDPYFYDKLKSEQTQQSSIKKTEVGLARKIESLTLNEGYQKKIAIFTLDTTVSSGSDKEHLKNVASIFDFNERKLDPIQYNLDDAHPLINWIDSLSICN